MRYRGRRAEEEDEEEFAEDEDLDEEDEDSDDSDDDSDPDDEEEEAFDEDEDPEEEAEGDDEDDDEDDQEPEEEEESAKARRGPSWAWDFVHPLKSGKSRRGSRVLIQQRSVEEDDEHIEGTTLFVASTDDEDRAMDVVKQDWSLRDFRNNPVILDNHTYMRVVGKGIDTKVPRKGKDAGRLMIRVGWDLENPDPSLRAVGHQHLNGFRSAGSVGFTYGKKTARNKLDPSDPYYRDAVEVETWWGGTYEMSGYLFEKNVLLEFSSATIPANPNALQRSLIQELGLLEPGDLERRARTVGKTVPKRVADDLTSYLRDPKNRRAALDLLWPDLLEKARKDPSFRRLLRALADSSGSPSPTRSSAPDLFEQVAALLE